MREKENLRVDLKAGHSYLHQGEYRFMVKVVDVLGNETNKVIKVKA